jgi:preprotein translocase subunit Sec61beta
VTKNPHLVQNTKSRAAPCLDATVAFRDFKVLSFLLFFNDPLQSDSAKQQLAAVRAGGMRVGGGAPGSAKKQASTGPIAGAASAGGFAHFQEEGAGIQLTPASVVMSSALFIGVVFLLHIYGRLTS